MVDAHKLKSTERADSPDPGCAKRPPVVSWGGDCVCGRLQVGADTLECPAHQCLSIDDWHVG